MPDPTKKTISATQIAALFDCNPWETRYTLYHWFKGNEVPKDEDGRMSWGKKMEPLLLEQAAADLALEITPCQQYVSFGPVGCTKDATVICPDRGPGALETKCVFDYGVWMREWNGGKNPPRHYEIQLQAQMLVGDGDGKTPYVWGILSAWVGGEMHYFERKPNFELLDVIAEKVAEFLDDVANDREPEPFGSPVELPLLAKLYPVAEERLSLESESSELEEDARLYAWSKKQKSIFTKMEEQLKAKLLAHAADNGAVYFPNGTALYIKKSTTKAKIVQKRDVGKVARKSSVRTSLTVKEGEGNPDAPNQEFTI